MRAIDPTIDSILKAYPKVREPLPPKYRNVYEQLYSYSRQGKSRAAQLALWLEGWMHRAAAADPIFPVLEVGAGTLNHVEYEPSDGAYDVVEPQPYLYESHVSRKQRIRSFYADVADLPVDRRYRRIISIAVLEHVLDLPRVLACLTIATERGGIVRMGIPTEGSASWFLAWRFGTGPSFKRRFGLDYGVFQRFEHVNSAREIEALLRFFFDEVRIKRFPLPLFHASFYTLIDASSPRYDRAEQYLAKR